MENELYHIGVKYRSGRYPYGSGDNPYQHDGNFYQMVKDLRDQGLTDKDICDYFEIKPTQLKAYYSASKDYFKKDLNIQIRNLAEQGYSNSTIAEKLNVAPNTVKNYLTKNMEASLNKNAETAERLRAQIDEKGVIDIGYGTELEVGVSQERLKVASEMLRAEGYKIYDIRIEQLGTGNKTTVKVIAKPDITKQEITENKDMIKSWTDYSVDNGKTWANILPPEVMTLDRIEIKYAEQGGTQKDGVIELRRGVEDVSLGNAQYAQVRIAVEGNRYIKGMAMYSDDLPPGIDIRVNSNKSMEKGVDGALKSMYKKDKKGNLVLDENGKPFVDPDNPFGATIKAGGQTYFDDPNGKYVNPVTGKPASISKCNKLTEEGDWSEWSAVLPSQFLSKQKQELIDRQLNLTYADKEIQFKEIMSLTNPAIKQKMLEDFADSCDSAAVHLKAVGLPRQGAHVILPMNSMKDNEIYAPNYKDGEHVVLIRYPHGGTFEIPELVVNNKEPNAKKLLGNATDAVGINTKVAQKLSGADFDGDTVQVIPVNSRVKVTTSKTPEALVGFADKMDILYGPDSTSKKYKIMTESNKQLEMGKVSNLITDMTLKGAPVDDIVKATKHSMVVIDAVKHKLNYEQSYVDNDIANLKERYQGGKDKGASTLISRAKGVDYVPERNGTTYIDSETGEKIWKETGRTYKKPLKDKDGNNLVDENGKVIYGDKVHTATTKTTKMASHKDAYELLSDDPNPKEIAYANYANKMKALGNEARRELKATKNLEYSPSAKEVYKEEVDSLNFKLQNAIKNAPKERQAQVMANAALDMKRKSNPDMDNETSKKLKNQLLAGARAKYGSNKKAVNVDITDKEWEAIQAGAISHSKVLQILNNTDIDKVKERALPRTVGTVSEAKQATIQAMKASGNYTIQEIAERVGVSTSTVSKYLRNQES